MVDIEVDQTLKNDTEVSRQEVIDTKVDKKITSWYWNQSSQATRGQWLPIQSYKTRLYIWWLQSWFREAIISSHEEIESARSIRKSKSWGWSESKANLCK